MKAITLIEPWATLFLSPEKQWETRSWQTHFRGCLAVHTSARLPAWARELCAQEPFKSALARCGIMYPSEFRLGQIIGAVNLTGIVPTEYLASSAAVDLPKGSCELTFGDYAPGRFAWGRSSDVFRLDETIAYPGARMLWTLPFWVERQVRREMLAAGWPHLNRATSGECIVSPRASSAPDPSESTLFEINAVMNKIRPPQPKPGEIVFVVEEQITRHQKMLYPGDIFSIKKTSSRVHVDRWLSEGRIKELPPSAPEPDAPPAVAVQSGEAPPSFPAEHGNCPVFDPREIAPSPVNPRRQFDREKMEELVASVRVQGVRTPINIRPMPPGQWYVIAEYKDSDRAKAKYAICDRRRGLTVFPADIMQTIFDTREEADAALPKYEIIAGERRWRAARIAGCASIRAVIEHMSDEEAAELQIMENDQRADLTPLEAAAGYRHLLDLPGYSMEKLLTKTGLAKNTIYGRLKLLELPEPARVAVEKGALPVSTAEFLARQEGAVQERAIAAVLHPDPDEDEVEDGEKVLSLAAAKEKVKYIKWEEERKDLSAKAKAEMEAQGYEVLEGEMAKGICSYSDTVAPNCGYVDARAVCPRDPLGRTWTEFVESIRAQGVIEREGYVISKLAVIAESPPAPTGSRSFRGHVISKLAVIAESHREGYKGVPVFARDQVNAVLKTLGLWEPMHGSKVAQEKEANKAALQKRQQNTEGMNADIATIVALAQRPENLRGALLAAVWAATEDSISAAEFVARRRGWIEPDDEESAGDRVTRSMATDLELDELQGLVVELAIAQMGREKSFFAESRKEIRALMGISTPESADAALSGA